MVGPPGALRPPLRSSWLGVSGPASGGAVILFNQALFPPEWVDGRPLPRASVHRRQGSPAGLNPGPSHAWHVRGSTIPGVLCRQSSRLGIGLGRGLATWLPCQGCGAVCVCVQALTRACGLGSQPLPDLRPPQVGITRFTWALPMRGAVRADPPMGPGGLSQAFHCDTIRNPLPLTQSPSHVVPAAALPPAPVHISKEKINLFMLM